MWIVMNDAYLSIVDKAYGFGELLSVRARVKGDIEKVFPDAKVFESAKTDYRFRAMISRKEVAAKIADRIENIRYPNFKDSVVENWRHDAYAEIWGVMFQVQYERTGRAFRDDYWVGEYYAQRYGVDFDSRESYDKHIAKTVDKHIAKTVNSKKTKKKAKGRILEDLSKTVQPTINLINKEDK